MDDSKHILCFLSAIFLLSNFTILLPMAQSLSIVNNSQLSPYIVHVQHPTGVALLSADEREDFYRSFLPNSTLDSGEPRLIYSYDVVMSGFAARLTPEEVRDMESMDGFVHAYSGKPYTLHTTYTPQLLGLHQGNSLWMDTNYGEGVIVGVLDSGITPAHPSFADDGNMPLPPLKWRGQCGFKANICNNKLIGAVAFIKYKKSPEPYDSTGHGTHVSGIAVGVEVNDASVLGQGRGTASGMAPKAHLAVYRVCSRGCNSADVLKGFDQAIQDGVDIINLSLGHEESRFLTPNAQGTFAAMMKGVVPVASAGNSGHMKSKIENTAPWILTVGAASTDRRATAVVRLGNGMEFVGQSAYQPSSPKLTNLPLVYPGVKGTQITLSCQNGSMEGFDVKGKIVICGTGCGGDPPIDCDRVNKGKVVKEAGGAGMIVVSQPWEGYTTNADPHVIPTAHINFVDTAKLVFEYLQTEKNPTATIEFKGTNFGARPSPTVASFSSRGPGLLNGGILKPDLIAPGVDILSAWHTEVGPIPTGSTNNYFFASGTSMAAPHVAGIAALLKKKHPQWSVAAIKSALMTTARRTDRDGNPIADDKSETFDPANVFAVGAGHVDPLAAVDPGLIYDTQPDEYISYLCGIKQPKLSDRDISTIVNKRISCSSLIKISTEQLNYPSVLVSLGKSTPKMTVTRTVTNVGKASSTYTAYVRKPNGVEVTVTPRTLQFSNIDQKEVFTIDFSLTGSPPEGDDIQEGELSWVSSDNKYTVRSPIVVTA